MYGFGSSPMEKYLPVFTRPTTCLSFPRVRTVFPMGSSPGQNRWAPGRRRWAEACLAEDDRGRMLWIHCRHPHDMHTFNEILLDLPLGLVAAQHLEGGAEAQFWIDPEIDDAAGNAALAIPIPNVLGIRPRASR